MKLLIDQNLPRVLVADLQSKFPDTSHVWFLGLASASDEEVWRYAAAEGYIIVSKDTDFINLSILRGHPPKVVYLKVGNCSTSAVRELLKARAESILEFAHDAVNSVVIVQLAAVAAVVK
jgi:predicted nuclease of predicted toxin-antitoxin system